MRILAFLIIIFVSQPILGQIKQDSLLNVWKNTSTPDTSRLNALRDYYWDGYMDNQPDSAIYFANLRYQYAKEKGIPKHMSGALNSLGVAYKKKTQYEKSLSYFNKSIELNERTRNKSGEAYAFLYKNKDG